MDVDWPNMIPGSGGLGFQGFGALGLGFWGLGFKVLGFRVQGFGKLINSSHLQYLPRVPKKQPHLQNVRS